MWKRWPALALAAAFVAFLGWMLALGQYGSLTVGLGVLAGSFGAYWLTELRLPAAGFWAVTASLVALAVLMVSSLSGVTEGFPAYAVSFIFGAILFSCLVLLINRFGPSRTRRDSVRSELPASEVCVARSRGLETFVPGNDVGWRGER